jgi:hypothetical protein
MVTLAGCGYNRPGRSAGRGLWPDPITSAEGNEYSERSEEGGTKEVAKEETPTY